MGPVAGYIYIKRMKIDTSQIEEVGKIEKMETPGSIKLLKKDRKRWEKMGKYGKRWKKRWKKDGETWKHKALELLLPPLQPPSQVCRADS